MTNGLKAGVAALALLGASACSENYAGEGAGAGAVVGAGVAAATGGEGLRIDADGTIPDALNMPWRVLDMIGEGHVERVEFAVDANCPLTITFNPPSYNAPIDISTGANLPVEVTVEVPADLDPALTQVTCEIQVLADGALVATQTIEVTIP